MSSRFLYRVKRMERKITAPGVCSECGGLNRPAVIMEHDPLPEPCTRCGREWAVVRLVPAVPPEDRNPPKNIKDGLD